MTIHVNHYTITESDNHHFWVASDDRIPEFQQMFESRDEAIAWALSH